MNHTIHHRIVRRYDLGRIIDEPSSTITIQVGIEETSLHILGFDIAGAERRGIVSAYPIALAINDVIIDHLLYCFGRIQESLKGREAFLCQIVVHSLIIRNEAGVFTIRCHQGEGIDFLQSLLKLRVLWVGFQKVLDGFARKSPVVVADIIRVGTSSSHYHAQQTGQNDNPLF